MLRINPYKETNITPYSSLDEVQPESKKMRRDPEGCFTEDSFKNVEINFWDAVPVMVAGNNNNWPISNSPWPGERTFSSFEGTQFSSTEIEDEENWRDAYNILKYNADPAPLLAFIQKGGNLLDDEELTEIIELANIKYPEIIFSLFQHYTEQMMESEIVIDDAFIPENSELIEALLRNDPNMDWKRYCYINFFEHPHEWSWVKEPLLGLILEYGETLSSTQKKAYQDDRNCFLAEDLNNWKHAYKILKNSSDPAPMLASIQKGLLIVLDDYYRAKILDMANDKCPEIAFECCKYFSAEYVEKIDYDIWGPIFIQKNLAWIESFLRSAPHTAWKKRLHEEITSHPKDWQWMPNHLLKIIYECEEEIILEDNTYQDLKSALITQCSNGTVNGLDYVKILLQNEPKIKMFDHYEWNSNFSEERWQDFDPRINDEVNGYIQRKIAAKKKWERESKLELANESIDLGYTHDDHLSDQKRIDTLNRAVLGNNAHWVKIALNMPECHDVQRWKKTVFNHFISNPAPQIKKLLQCHLQKHLRYWEDPSDLEA